MKNFCFKKKLVFGIIILFVGTSIVPSITGLIGKTSNQLTKEPTIFPLYADYMNAYWKFDENSGSNAHDTSIHHNDGTIYGATWTTGYSNSALLFDGVNDYIDLDAHASNLGFNKTDDMIFSFWFKSSQYTLGRIYSTSSAIGTNPEIQIFLAPNGTIAIKAVVTSCGFTLYTNNSYNDNVWHYVEIWYNGITNEPTTTIYVDNALDASITAWVCPFDHNEFTITKIGRKSNESTDYFNGKIDEFKIIKYGGGNEQNPPTITGPTNGKIGVNYDFTFKVDDPEDDDIWYYIDWGDGTNTDWFGPYPSGQEITKTHKWLANGTYDIWGKSKDIWHFSNKSHHIIAIGNIPPYAPTITGPGLGEIGETLSYSFKAIDNDGDQVSYYIDWGDGSITDWTPFQGSGTSYSGSHAWNLADDYEIKAKAKDANGVEGDWSVPYPVRIGNQPPGIPTITGETSGNTGTEYNYLFSAIDPEKDKVSYYIDWGDGTNTGWLDPHPSGFVLNEGHTWSVRGTYTITVKAKDYPYEAESAVGTLRVIMPRSRSLIHSPLLLLIEKLMERFQHLYHVIHVLMIN
jgi:hypothetical protein